MPLDELSDHFGFAPVPAGPRGAPASVAGTMVYAILRQAAQPRLAMRLLARARRAGGARAPIARATGRIPARRSAVALAAPGLPFLAQTADLLEHAVTRPSTPLYPRVSVAAAGDARGGAHRTARSGRGGSAHGRADRRGHRPAGAQRRRAVEGRRSGPAPRSRQRRSSLDVAGPRRSNHARKSRARVAQVRHAANCLAPCSRDDAHTPFVRADDWR